MRYIDNKSIDSAEEDTAVMNGKKKSLMLSSVLMYSSWGLDWGAEVGSGLEDLFVDLSQDTGVGAESRRNVFVLEEEFDGAFEKPFQDFFLDELTEI